MESSCSLSQTEIKPSDVYDVLEDRKFVEKLYNEMLLDIESSSAYKQLKDITSEIDSNHIKPIQNKKNMNCKVGYLCDCLASTLTKTVQDKLHTFQDDIYAASQAVIEELDKKNSENGGCSINSLSKQSKNYSTPPKKRRMESNSESKVSPSKRLSNRLKKPNSKYYSENILTSMTEYCFDETSN